MYVHTLTYATYSDILMAGLDSGTCSVLYLV